MDSELIHKFIGQVEKETVEQFQEVENLLKKADYLSITGLRIAVDLYL